MAKKKSAAQLNREIAAAGKTRELKGLEQTREQLLRALGYAGNTPDQVMRYHDKIVAIDAQIKALLR